MDEKIIRQMLISELTQKVTGFQKEHPEIRIAYLIGILECFKNKNLTYSENDPSHIIEFLTDMHKRLKFYHDEHKVSMIEIAGIIITLQYNYMILVENMKKQSENQNKEKANG